MTAFQSTVRDLRHFETTARQIGSAEHDDRQLQRAAESLRATASEYALASIGRIQLVEILRGSDAAMAMWTAAGA